MILLFLISIQFVDSDIFNFDSYGLFYNISPFMPEKGNVHLLANTYLGIGARTDIISRKYGEDPTTQYAYRKGDLRMYGNAVAGIGVVPFNNFELFLGGLPWGKYIYRHEKYTFRLDTRYVTLKHIMGGIKTSFLSYIENYLLGIGGAVWFTWWAENFINKFYTETVPYYISCEFDTTKATFMELGIRFLVGLQTPLGTTFLNAGYLYKTFYEGTGGFNSFGVGQEFNIWKYFHLAVEYSKQDTIGTIRPMGRLLLPYFTLSFGVGIPVGGNFDWVPDDTLDKKPSLNLSINPNITIKFPPKPKPTIVVKGNIYDSLTMKLIPATITFIGPLSGKVEAPEGKFNLSFIKPGSYRIGFESPDYRWVEKVYYLMPYDTVEVGIGMLRVIDWSIVGRVTDAETKKGVPAVIKLIGKKEVRTLSDPKTGYYKIWANAGDYELVVEAENYIKWRKKVKITGETTETINVSLRKKK